MGKTEQISRMSAQNLSMLGLDTVAYVKPVIVEDKPACAVHAANGAVIAVLPTRDVAFAAIRQNDLEPVSVH